jgi:hypothetical protein
MDKKEYYSISTKLKLPNRCPIVGKCERWALTILYFSDLYKQSRNKNPYDVLADYGIVSPNFKDNLILVLDEMPEYHKSDILIYYHNFCPEISLFNSEYRLCFIPQIASTDGEWDDFRINQKFKNSKCKHYSECLEFSKFHYDNKSFAKEKRITKKRPPISKVLRFEIFQRDNFTCQYCNRTKDDGIKLVVDHIIPVSEGGKTIFDNLITACEECNSGKSNKLL